MKLTPAEAKALAGLREKLTKDLLIQHLRSELHKANEQIKAASPVLADRIEQLEGVVTAQEARIQTLLSEIKATKSTEKKLADVKAILGPLALALELVPEPEESDWPEDDDE